MDCDGLSFRHRNGQYWAALDQFYADASSLSDAAWVVNTEVLGIVTGLSDHAPVVCKARLLPRGLVRRLADTTVRHPLFRKTYQSELDFQCGRRTGKAYCTKDKSGNGKIRRNPLLGVLHSEEWDWHGCASRAASKAVRACPPSPTGMTNAFVPGLVLLQKHIRGNLGTETLTQVAVINPVAWTWVEVSSV